MNNINILHQAMNAASLRQQVISNNIANAETPGYKAKKVVFEDILKQHLSAQTNNNNFVNTRTDPRHIDFSNSSSSQLPIVVENRQAIMNNNSNSVDLDYEMTEMGKNAIWYNTLTYQVNNEIQKLSIAITGRR